MKAATTIVKLFCLMIMGSISLQAVGQNEHRFQTINPVIGDVSYVTAFGHDPDGTENEQVRIATHLAYAEHLIRQRPTDHLTPDLRERRTMILDLLHDYWTAGKFPRNYDYPGQRRPCFIDRDATICAVGYLVEQTAGRDVAEAINKKFQYAELLDMYDYDLKAWIASSGLTAEECATIQPTYGGGGPCGYIPCCPNNKQYTCRESNCTYECKCVSVNNVDHWVTNGHPCDTIANGNGNGNGGNGPGRIMGSVFENGSSSFVYPNPSNGYATIRFFLDQSQRVFISATDITGRVITVSPVSLFQEGTHEFPWNTESVTPGMYILQVSTDSDRWLARVNIVN